MTSVLSIVTTGYRATMEEQDDTILWFTAMCAKTGLDIEVLLEGPAVNYAVTGHDAGGLRFGDLAVEHPPVLDHDVAELVRQGVGVHYVVEDLDALGVAEDRLVDGVQPLKRDELPQLFDGFDQIWRW